MTDISSQELSDSCFDGFVNIIDRVSGITIEKGRKSMLVGRIRRRVRELKLGSYDKYLQYIKDHRDEESNFINLITTNETYFYRTPRVWDFITNDFLCNWYQENHGKKLKIWSAASSTGEEAHTAGVICQDFKIANPGFQYSVLGTDISTDVVARATKGLYIGRAVERFQRTNPQLFKKHMVGDAENGYQVASIVKANISFKKHNLFKSFNNNEKFDLILLRNVLIYFTKENQKRVLANIHRCLSSDGYLIIGESESLSRIGADFESVSPLIYKPIVE